MIVKAKIGTDGRLLAAEIFQGADPLLDAEALRMVHQLEAWTPAVVDGEPAEMDVLIPIRFALQ